MNNIETKIAEIKSKIGAGNKDEAITNLFKETFKEEVKAAETKEEAKKEEEFDDTYYYDEQTNSKRPNPYSNKRRKEIEKRCSKIDLVNTLLTQRVEQKIPVVPGKFELLVRDTTGIEDTFIKNQLAKEYYDRNEVSSAYLTSKMARYRLTFGILSINGTPFTDISIDNEPATDAEIKAFKEKLKFISKYPDDILQELDTQYIWFKDRIKLISMADMQDF